MCYLLCSWSWNFRKFLFLRYEPKCSQLIALLYSSINHISRTNQWVFTCSLWRNNFWLDQHCTLYLCLLNASLLQLYLLYAWLLPEGSYKIGLFVLPSCCLSGCFLEIVSLDFSDFWHHARNLYEVVYGKATFFGKFFLPQKLGKWSKNSQERGFLI